MPDEIPVFFLSYERPLYLWASLDSFYRNTDYPRRFILADNNSTDPLVRQVIHGFERRGMFFGVHLEADNDPRRLSWLLDRYRSILPRYFVFAETDVIVAASHPCWLTRLVQLMDRDERLGMLGSKVDTSDFVDSASVAHLDPGLDASLRRQLLKADSLERRSDELCQDEISSPFNPPGRLLIVRTETLGSVAVAPDTIWHENMLAHQYKTGIASGVVHRHLSLNNIFDYSDYDVFARNRFFRRSGEVMQDKRNSKRNTPGLSAIRRLYNGILPLFR